jgi:hypothetical protein
MHHIRSAVVTCSVVIHAVALQCVFGSKIEPWGPVHLSAVCLPCVSTSVLTSLRSSTELLAVLICQTTEIKTASS